MLSLPLMMAFLVGENLNGFHVWVLTQHPIDRIVFLHGQFFGNKVPVGFKLLNPDMAGKAEHLWPTATWKPDVNPMVTSMAATLMAVAAMARRIINREKDCCLLKATRLAMNAAIFNDRDLENQK